MRRNLLSVGLALLTFLGILIPSTLCSHFAIALQSSSPPFTAHDNAHQVVNVILAGATGDLAAKYLWVALFRLALESKSTSERRFRFFAGASDTLERGRAWQEKFFDEVFAERVCGSFEEDQEQVSTSQIKCREFLETEFKPRVQYSPLRTENNYQELGRRLNKHEGKEEGRIVYLAIPPQFFRQSCELIHRYLRPQSLETGSADPFLRVVVEKPFGRDLQSAHDLATHLRAICSRDELYVMDHYAGKPVVHALRNYFQLNAAVLHPLWNAKYIQDIHIEMTETATLQNRVHYFDSAGIIRDIMVNHLQLLLNVAVVPSFDASIYTVSISSSESARRVHEAQLRFIEALKIPYEHSQYQQSLFVAQYDEYAAHYEDEMDESLDESDHFTPTAAMVELISSSNEWRNTTFRLAAAKATAVRLLAITITFRDGIFSNTEAHPCNFTVIIQRERNADSRHSHRIEWSCAIDKLLPELQLPYGWEYLNPDDHRVITPTEDKLSLERDMEVAAWDLGDEPSAYDILLREVANGNTEHFADLNEVEAAWVLWTPIVNAAESLVSQPVSKTTTFLNQTSLDIQVLHATYPAGTSPWEQFHPNSRYDDTSPAPREEL